VEIVILASANSIHTVRWANGLVSRGIVVHLVSVHEQSHILDPRIQLHLLPVKAPWGYLLAVSALKKLLKKINPCLINAHYATGYGLLARLAGCKPLLLSVWGSDVYNFPQKSILHRLLLKGNLKCADAIASTSQCMASKTSETFLHKHVFITPFGIDEMLFSPVNVKREFSGIVIGTIKTLHPNYGIDTLIYAFARIVNKLKGTLQVRLEITGNGPDFEVLQKLAYDLKVSNRIVFHGFVNHFQIPEMVNRLDIYVALSRSESFGVAILEANACGKPVVVSDAEGLVEVTLNGQTGLIVPKNDINAASDAILRLIQDPDLRYRLGGLGRKHVLKHYTWDRTLDIMIDAYKKTIVLSKQ
jgi:L-malate glycosyltransferase